MKRKPATCQCLLCPDLVSFPVRRTADGKQSTPPPSHFVVQCPKFAVANLRPLLRAKSHLHQGYTYGRCSPDGDGFCTQNVARNFGTASFPKKEGPSAVQRAPLQRRWCWFSSDQARAQKVRQELRATELGKCLRRKLRLAMGQKAVFASGAVSSSSWIRCRI